MVFGTVPRLLSNWFTYDRIDPYRPGKTRCYLCETICIFATEGYV